MFNNKFYLSEISLWYPNWEIAQNMEHLSDVEDNWLKNGWNVHSFHHDSFIADDTNINKHLDFGDISFESQLFDGIVSDGQLIAAYTVSRRKSIEKDDYNRYLDYIEQGNSSIHCIYNEEEGMDYYVPTLNLRFLHEEESNWFPTAEEIQLYTENHPEIETSVKYSLCMMKRNAIASNCLELDFDRMRAYRCPHNKVSSDFLMKLRNQELARIASNFNR